MSNYLQKDIDMWANELNYNTGICHEMIISSGLMGGDATAHF